MLHLLLAMAWRQSRWQSYNKASKQPCNTAEQGVLKLDELRSVHLNLLIRTDEPGVQLTGLVSYHHNAGPLFAAGLWSRLQWLRQQRCWPELICSLCLFGAQLSIWLIVLTAGGC